MEIVTKSNKLTVPTSDNYLSMVSKCMLVHVHEKSEEEAPTPDYNRESKGRERGQGAGA